MTVDCPHCGKVTELLLAPDARVVAKHFWRDLAAPVVTGAQAAGPLLASVRERRFGETALTFHRWEAG